MASTSVLLHLSLGGFRLTLPAKYTPVLVAIMLALVRRSVPSQMPSRNLSASASLFLTSLFVLGGLNNTLSPNSASGSRHEYPLIDW